MHVPVLKQEVLKYLAPKPNENFVDATLGFGGHALAILEKTAPRGKVLGIEWDPVAFESPKSEARNPKWKQRLVLVNDTYVNIGEIVKRVKFPKISGILFDLGISSWQLEESKRGFSFQKNEVLDMRFNPEHGLDAKKILNFWSRFDIQGILKDYGEEQFAESIARHIVEARKRSPVVRTFQLVEIVKAATPGWYHRRKLHPATKTFQALRIASNSELENLRSVLPQTVSLLSPGGRLLVISFHSLEDRIVKNFFRQDRRLQIRTKKPVVASPEEQKANPKSRSAKLRAAIRIE
ncbi:MAG: 16S rRNA (cytosine(1402)-N(4))-methyltransferase RsmH [Candidatus Wildermuthbacteria bacterium]|nr:16S rRNA (cytosine(1402)-N(4))-methyltransferase RsmH [Candidatus Wildermuthbacteria bacterium]